MVGDGKDHNIEPAINKAADAHKDDPRSKSTDPNSAMEKLAAAAKGEKHETDKHDGHETTADAPRRHTDKMLQETQDFGKAVPDKVLMHDRAEAGVKEYIDKVSGAQYKYDELGRISEVKTADGNLTTVHYKSNSNNPSQFEIRDKNGHLIAQNSGELAINQNTGEIKNWLQKDPRGQLESKTETRYSPDGKIKSTHFDVHGHRLSDETCTATAAGPKLVSQTRYIYGDAQGKPTTDPSAIDESKPVISEVKNASGKVTDRYTYPQLKNIDAGKPAAHERIKYSEDAARQQTTEHHEIYNLRDRMNRSPLLTVDKVRDQKNGTTAIDTTLANGINQHVKYAADGKAVELSRQEGNDKYSFALKDGAITSVKRNGQELGGKELNEARNCGQLLIETTRRQFELESRTGSPKEDIGPTAARAGDHPGGTLSFKEGNTYCQATVENGALKNEKGQQIGSVKDDGSVTINAGVEVNGKSLGQRSFKISDTDSAAFHGAGSDHAPLELVSKKQSDGLNGTFSSPDGKDSYAVVSGNLYDHTGHFVGHMGSDGKIQLAKDNSVEDINSFKDGWKFEGNQKVRDVRGVEIEQPRFFECSRQSTSGKISIPDQSGKTSPDESGKTYEVRMGMVIDKDGQQIGLLKPPVESADGTMTGGAIVSGNPLHEIPLENFKNAVFDLHVMGQGGVHGRDLKGVCRGPHELQADGSPKPSAGGGILNISEAIAREERKAQDAEKRLNEAKNSWNLIGKGADQDIARSELELAKRHKQWFQDLLAPGHAETQRIDNLALIDKQERTEDRTPTDALAAMKNKLDSAEHTLEPLPKEPRDISKISGSVLLDVPSAKDPHAKLELKIKNGRICVTDPMTHADRVIGSIDGPDGRMTIVNQQTGKPMEVQMKNVQPGAIWHLLIPGADGKPQKVDWVSLGDKDGIVSVNQLKHQAQAEVDYAKAVDNQSHSEESKAALEITLAKQKTYEAKLDRIMQKGATQGDLAYLLKRPQDLVRAGDYKDAQEKPRKHIEVPRLISPEELKLVNGRMRLGSEVYNIRKGDVYLVHSRGGKPVEDKCGHLGPGYTLCLDGRPPPPLALAEQNRLLMQIKVGNNQEEHKIIGLGAERTTADIGHTSGGLVDTRELIQQATLAKAESAKTFDEYYGNRSYLMTAINPAVSFVTGGQLDVDRMIGKYQEAFDQLTGKMRTQVDGLFASGFDDSKCNNNNIDDTVAKTQLLATFLKVDTDTSKSLAQQAQQADKTTTDAVVMAATTVATAGVGTLAGAAIGAYKLAVVGKTLIAVGELAADSGLGAGISVVGRSSATSNTQDLALSGAYEGGAMGSGSLFGRGAQALTKLAESGVKKGILSTKLLGTANVAIQVSQKVGGAYVQTRGFAWAGATRDHDYSQISDSNIGMGTMWMLASEGVVGTAFKGLGRLAGKEADTAGAAVSKEAAEQAAAKDSKFFDRAELATRVAHDASMAYTNAGLSAMGEARESERQRIAAEMHIKPELVSDAMLNSRMNWGNVLAKMNESGLQGMATAPLLTVATHIATRPLEHAATRMIEKLAQAHGYTSESGPAEGQHPNYAPDTSLTQSDSISGFPAVTIGGLGISAGNDAHSSQSSPPEVHLADGTQIPAVPGAPAAPAGLPPPATPDAGASVATQTPTGSPIPLAISDGNTTLAQSGNPSGQASTVTQGDSSPPSQILSPNQPGQSLTAATGDTPVTPQQTPGTTAPNLSTQTPTAAKGDAPVTPQPTPGTTTPNLSAETPAAAKGDAPPDSNRETITRSADGVVEKVSSTGFPTLLEVNHEVEQKRLENLTHQVSSKDKADAIRAAMVEFEKTAPERGLDTQEIGRVYHEVSKLLGTDKAIVPADERAILAAFVLENAAHPSSINQGRYQTCGVTTLEKCMFADCPAEVVARITEAVTTGSVKTSSGKTIHISPEDLEMNAHTLEQFTSDPSLVQAHRNYANQIIQTVLANTHFQGQEVTVGEITYPPGRIRYELREPTEQGTGECLVDTVTGAVISNSTTVPPHEMERVYGELTGRSESPLIIHSEYTSDNFHHGQKFDSPESLLKLFKDKGGSERKPLILYVNPSAEPFYRESGMGVAGGGQGDLDHVVCVTDIREENGRLMAYVDNSWGKSAQHTKESGKPIPLSDLYLATLPKFSSQRIELLRSEAEGNPVKQLELYRAMYERTKSVIRACEEDCAKKTPEDAENTRLSVREHQKDLFMSREEYERKLEEMVNTLPKLSDLSSQDFAYANLLASHELKKLFDEGGQKGTGISKYLNKNASDTGQTPLEDLLADNYKLKMAGAMINDQSDPTKKSRPAASAANKPARVIRAGRLKSIQLGEDQTLDQHGNVVPIKKSPSTAQDTNNSEIGTSSVHEVVGPPRDAVSPEERVNPSLRSQTQTPEKTAEYPANSQADLNPPAEPKPTAADRPAQKAQAPVLETDAPETLNKVQTPKAEKPAASADAAQVEKISTPSTPSGKPHTLTPAGGFQGFTTREMLEKLDLSLSQADLKPPQKDNLKRIKSTLSDPKLEPETREFIDRNFQALEDAARREQKPSFENYLKILKEANKEIKHLNIELIEPSVLRCNRVTEQNKKSYMRMASRLSNVDSEIMATNMSSCSDKAKLASLVKQKIRDEILVIGAQSQYIDRASTSTNERMFFDRKLERLADFNEVFDQLGRSPEHADCGYKKLTELIPNAKALAVDNANVIWSHAKSVADRQDRKELEQALVLAKEQKLEQAKSEASAELSRFGQEISLLGLPAESTRHIVESVEAIINASKQSRHAHLLQEQMKEWTQKYGQEFRDPGATGRPDMLSRFQAIDSILSAAQIKGPPFSDEGGYTIIRAMLNPNVTTPEVERYDYLLWQSKLAEPKALLPQFSDQQSEQIATAFNGELVRVASDLALRDKPQGHYPDPFRVIEETHQVLQEAARIKPLAKDPENVFARRTNVIANLLETNFNYRGNCGIDWDKVLKCDGIRSLELYEKLIRQSATSEGPHATDPGFEYEHKAGNRISDVLRHNKLNGGNCVFVPANHGSPADAVGIDGVFLNLDNNKFVPVDFASTLPALGNKFAKGKGMWAVHISEDILTKGTDQHVLDALQKFMDGTDTGSRDTAPPIFDLGNFTEGTGKKAEETKDANTGKVVPAPDLIPFPSFQSIKSEHEAKQLAGGGLTSKMEIEQLLEELRSSNLRRGNPGLEHLFRRTGDALYYKIREEKLNDEVGEAFAKGIEALSPFTFDTIDPIAQTPVQEAKVTDKKSRDLGKTYKYFEMKDPVDANIPYTRSGGLTEMVRVNISRIEIDPHGHVYGIQPADRSDQENSKIEIGKLDRVVRQAFGDQAYDSIKSQAYAPTDEQLLAYFLRNRLLLMERLNARNKLNKK